MPQVTLVPFETIQSVLDLEETDEGLISLLSFSATAEFENYTHRILSLREIGEFHDGYRQNTLELREYPVTAVASLNLWRSTTLPTFIPLDKTSYSYELNPAGPTVLRLNDSYSFPRGHQNIKVIYAAGYTVDTLPDDLMMAFCETVGWLFKRLKARQIGVTQLVDEKNRVSRFSYDKTLPDHVREMLQSYRKKGW